VSNEIQNFSRLADSEGSIAYTAVTIGYDTPWRQVEAMLIQAASRTEGIRSKPAPFVLQTVLGDFYAEYQLNVSLKSPELRPRTIPKLHAHIHDVFNEYGVQIMSPHYIADPPAAKIVAKQDWFAAPAQSNDVAPALQPGTS
jgi:small-conductance mechanosensitive channel